MRLYSTKMSENTKQVRVDNWGIFFLQRLQMFFSKTDYCDLTLQFDGNVQLKVHRLVMNACTEYFQFLEQTCMVLEDNVIMMPADLQADVIVPIVNFMYTGMLEFHLSLYDKLYKTAELMNISILTKLLDAQKQPQATNLSKPVVKKGLANQTASHNVQAKKFVSNKSSLHHPELPATLPGRKLPIWKRKNIPTPSSTSFLTTSNTSNTNSTPTTTTTHHGYYSEQKRFSTSDPLLLTDNTPKPTRFEWPEDDLPTINMMDTSFEDISYTSKPLLTQEEELLRTNNSSFDDLKQQPNINRNLNSTNKTINQNLDMEEMKNYVKEQKIRTGLVTSSCSSSNDDEINEDIDLNCSGGIKRKSDLKIKNITKKVRFDTLTTTTTSEQSPQQQQQQQQEKDVVVNVALDTKTNTELNHTKIVSEILKKYPQLMKKNTNIRLKIMPNNNKSIIENIQIRSAEKINSNKLQVKSKKLNQDNKGPWICQKCSKDCGGPVEFVLYYLYRKHLTDIHNEKFDSKLCKYCGQYCSKLNLLMYHLYTKHGLKPPTTFNFPKCSHCPFIASSNLILTKHKLKHDLKNEVKCIECNLAFTSQHTLNAHVQITGHNGKSLKTTNFDCQYCTKRYQTCISLFSHVKTQHYNVAIRDGIVSIDESDDIDELDEQENDSRDEYILPEIITDSTTTTTSKDSKIKILSNVKMASGSKDNLTQQEQTNLTLVPSSEAEALSNVASGIATSLGLVDIVVLGENNEQYVLHSQNNVEEQQYEHTEQPEFILPELGEGEANFNENHHNSNQSGGGGGIISSTVGGDISSTDELVMVLTDHDYGDNQEEINNENSNIVVLYSHPVDGQQNQFITSQGNLMLNSQTGIIELRNEQQSENAATTSNVVVSSAAAATTTVVAATTTVTTDINTSQDSHIESIEMIQREIESHRDISKNETIQVKETTQQVEVNEQETIVSENEIKKENESIEDEEVRDDDLLDKSCDSNLINFETQEQFSNVETSSSPSTQSLCVLENQAKEVDDNNVVIGDEKLSESVEVVSKSNLNDGNVEREETSQEQQFDGNTTTTTTQAEILEVTQETKETQVQNDVEQNLNEDKTEIDGNNLTTTTTENQTEDLTNNKTQEMEQQDLNTSSLSREDDNFVSTNDESLENVVVTESVKEVEENLKTELPTINDTSDDRVVEEMDVKPEIQDNDLKEQTIDDKTKISILDDWDDTDSQQSSTTHQQQHSKLDVVNKETNSQTSQTVHKTLMDDWEDDEDDDNNKECPE